MHLRRSRPLQAESDALAAAAGGRLGLHGLVDALVANADPRTRQGRGALAPRLLGRAVDWAFTWDRADRRDRRWWPQGITSSSDGADPERSRGRDLVVTSWYSKKPDGVTHGARVTVVDLATLRYQHVLLVVPTVVDGALTLEPLRVHAGGLVWHGPWLHVAATGRGFMTCHWDDLVRVTTGQEGLSVGPGGISAWGHTHLLPVRFTHQGLGTDQAPKLRFSFVSLDRSEPQPHLLAGEYGRARGQTRRVARFPIDAESGLLVEDDDGSTVALHLDESGVTRMQGAVVARGRWYATASVGAVLPGSVHAGTPGRLRPHHLATPIGPEDLSYWPEQDRLWTVTEHPWRRWVCAMRRSWFD
ncbi:hypothetical protein [Nocardioides alcanivorans]|uniref:hypothetical protein n=1 Tax=Nocardioides alcanivorans TaxID=2897352 RepID=UPI001F1CD014|nr:hypothetical protein [Nocardioides alcanivorans]